MITVRVSADIHEDRRVVLTLPPEVPVGRSELIVSVAEEPQPKRRSLGPVGRNGRNKTPNIGEPD